MKSTSLFLSALAFVAAASLALAVIRGFDVGDTPLALVVGAIVGSQVGAILHARQPDATSSAIPKLVLGAVLAVVALAFGFAVHLGLGGITYPEVTLPISAIGTFVFPFAVFNTMFNAIRNQRKPDA